ncbi:hypothetical protein COS54_01200 [Candidatus Shapirobacteria bacterium CG03_land_8_20_14_0_80_39_12]|uniref:O-antigen ligase-related domain-containing protein n=1 Tax=Candidatus Shapirobacteria bacterium CG03_land_8_20_14_0_80_39_12 TaxID=1974879 RepID=A0A2M7BDW8_9BACT|nr:MAG: hypothetical protein COS54_01200 [Candidatus Shapirobacteria bacterium CG03_land_8_20_14_0_80_39_12]
MAKLLKLIKDNFFYLGIGFLLFFIPVYPKFPLLGVSGTYVSIRLEDIFVAIIVGLFFLNLIIKKNFSIFKNHFSKLIFLFFAVGLVSLLSAIFITKNITLNVALFHFLRRIEYISLFFVAYYSLKNIKQLKTYGWMLLVATFAVIIYALGQKFFGWPVVSTMNKEFSKGMILKLTWWARVNSTFAGHYDLAAYMVMVLPLTLVAFLLSKKWFIKVIVFLLGILCYYILILTASRVSFGAYLLSMITVLFLSRKKLLIIPFLIVSLLGMIFSADLGQRYAATFKINLSFLSGTIKTPPSEIAVAPSLTPTPIPVVQISLPPVLPGKIRPTITPTPTPTPAPVATASAEYFESTEMATSRSTDIRLKVEWPRALRALAKNPLLGTGYSSITLATDNDYLRMLGEVGLLGTLAFWAVIWEFFRKIYKFLVTSKSKEEKLLLIGISGSAVGFFLNATFIDVMEASKIAFFFWILMGIALKIIDLNETEKTDMTN